MRGVQGSAVHRTRRTEASSAPVEERSDHSRCGLARFPRGQHTPHRSHDSLWTTCSTRVQGGSGLQFRVKWRVANERRSFLVALALIGLQVKPGRGRVERRFARAVGWLYLLLPCAALRYAFRFASMSFCCWCVLSGWPVSVSLSAAAAGLPCSCPGRLWIAGV